MGLDPGNEKREEKEIKRKEFRTEGLTMSGNKVQFFMKILNGRKQTSK